MTEMTKEEMLGYSCYLTVGRLKEFISKHDISDDALVVVEIVEDKYFNGGCDISGREGVVDGKLTTLPSGSRSSEWSVYMKDNGDGGKTPYHPVWSPVGYKEKDVLYLDLHY